MNAAALAQKQLALHTHARFSRRHTFERRPRRSLSEGRLSGSEGRFGVRTTALRPNAIGPSGRGPGTP